MKVDLAPQEGQYSSAALLNTRAVTATVVGRKHCSCSEGIVPKRNRKSTLVQHVLMLRHHIASDAIRATPASAESQDTECAGPTPPPARES